jgi:3-oxoacyl-[acyl-carrier protein] reductase
MESLVRTNLLSVFFVARAALEVMLPRGRGRIINIASEGGKAALPNLAVYGSCKAGVIAFTRLLAREVGGRGITVVGVSPGTMLTDDVVDHLRTIPADDPGNPHAQSFPRVSLERCSLPEEVARVVAFLATDAAGYVHGTTISVSGGMSD